MKNILKIIPLLLLLSFAQNATADARITVSKGDANLCEVIPTQAKKNSSGRSTFHYNKKAGEISTDLWHSGKNGLGFFKLNKTERESQTVHLAFVDKYSTFWYYTKNGSDVKGPYFYDFIVPENRGRIFVDIDLELPCSCYLRADKPNRCNTRYREYRPAKAPLMFYEGKFYSIEDFVSEFGVPNW
ncbi:hypothetical protein SPONL_2125 [uncultured Candidatus Thioglobus sp.]|nr:hypothetical protein SPONL_2125 [uncultured Candidatus Thioglobus sp.]